MNTFTKLVRREMRVALSLKAQPLWFRVLKWVVLVAFIARYHAASWFCPAAAIGFVTALGLHFLYRWKTRAWSHPWGGWNDVQSADGLR
jgi:hypothetical protein